MTLQLMRVSQIVANASEEKGGLLVHGALVEWNGTGVILAGPGGVGKTTASKRLPSTWRSLSDDTALIVKSHGRHVLGPPLADLEPVSAGRHERLVGCPGSP